MWACHRFFVDIYFRTMKSCQAPVAIHGKRQVTPASQQSAFSIQHPAFKPQKQCCSPFGDGSKLLPDRIKVLPANAGGAECFFG